MHPRRQSKFPTEAAPLSFATMLPLKMRKTRTAAIQKENLFAKREADDVLVSHFEKDLRSILVQQLLRQIQIDFELL